MNGGETDTFAAEFVLGTLDPDERRAAQSLLANDESFADRVRLWERRLGELHLMVEPVEPASDIWPRIKLRMPEVQQIVEAAVPEPASEPASNQEPKPELLPEWDFDPTVESQREPEGELQAESQSESEVEAEREPELVERKEEPAALVAADKAFESLLQALEKPEEKEPPPASEETPPPPPAAPSEPDAESAAKPSWHLPPGQVEEPEVRPAPPFVAPLPEREIAEETKTVQPEALRMIGRRLSRWRVATVLLLLLLAGLAGLVAAWRFIPDRIPQALQPVTLMRLAGIPLPASSPVRKPAPPESSYQE
jgi:anti-sigma-K factor RskA